MENMTAKQNPIVSVALPILLTLAGGALLGYSLYILPAAPAYGFPWAFAGAVAAFLLIMGGGFSFRRRGGNDYTHNYNSAVTFGLFVIIAGVLLLCFNSGALPGLWKKVFFSWQMLLILLGSGELCRRHFVGGGILFAVGVFFIIRRLAPIYPDIAASGFASTYWPILLIALGLMIIAGFVFRPVGSRRNHSGRHCIGSDCRRDTSGSGSSSGVVDISVGFGSAEQVYLDPVFQGGSISSVFGGVLLDLRRTELPEGDTYLKVESVFGGVEIYAPEGWNIEIRNESVFGGFADKRPHIGGRTYDDGRKLVIKASNVFGGGEIK